MLATTLPGTRAAAITESEVEEACADSREAYETYRQARSDFEQAAAALDEANTALDDAEYREQRIRGIYEGRQAEQDRLRAQVEETAAELYMQAAGSASSLGMMSLSTPSDALAAVEFLESSASRDLQTVNDLASISAELDRLGIDLQAAVDDLTSARNDQQDLTTDQESAMSSALEAYGQLDDHCRELQAEYEAEQARLRAEAEARRQREAEARERAASGGSGDSGDSGDSGGSSDTGGSNSSGPVVGGIVCPFSPGRTQFRNTWGAPRSGGRSHRGVDMFAPHGEPVYAVADGVVATGNRGLGGKHIWLTATNGSAFYYAHLDDFAVGSGTRVSQGDLIAYNGNTGNARGTSPHVHLQMHPGGRSSSPVNPYNAVASVCF